MCAVYFVLGAITAALAIASYFLHEENKVQTKAKMAKLESVRWRAVVPVNINEEVDGVQLNLYLASIVEKQTVKNMDELREITVQPGSYNISLNLNATFVKKD